MRASISNRLKEERQRLAKSQREFAAAIGCAKTTQCNYEQGHRSPDAEYLAAAHDEGIDILYVITGRRATPYKKEEVEIIEAVRTHPEAFAIGLLMSALAERESGLRKPQAETCGELENNEGRDHA